jgi:hypothetical protein
MNAFQCGGLAATNAIAGGISNNEPRAGVGWLLPNFQSACQAGWAPWHIRGNEGVRWRGGPKTRGRQLPGISLPDTRPAPSRLDGCTAALVPAGPCSLHPAARSRPHPRYYSTQDCKLDCSVHRAWVASIAEQKRTEAPFATALHSAEDTLDSTLSSVHPRHIEARFGFLLSAAMEGGRPLAFPSGWTRSWALSKRVAGRTMQSFSAKGTLQERPPVSKYLDSEFWYGVRALTTLPRSKQTVSREPPCPPRVCIPAVKCDYGVLCMSNVGRNFRDVSLPRFAFRCDGARRAGRGPFRARQTHLPIDCLYTVLRGSYACHQAHVFSHSSFSPFSLPSLPLFTPVVLESVSAKA